MPLGWLRYVGAYVLGVTVCYLTAPDNEARTSTAAAVATRAKAPLPCSLRPPAPSPPLSSECRCNAASAHKPGAPHRPRVPTAKCVDELAPLRRPNTTVAPSAVLARCALRWLADHVHVLGNHSSASVFDPAYDGVEHPLVTATSDSWLHLTALLPAAGIELPPKRVVPYQQVVLAPPTAHRLSSLLVTNSFFDVFLALRLDELSQLEGVPDFLSLLGRLVAMSKRTFVILPCAPHYNRLFRRDAKDVIKAGVAKAMAQAKEMGVLHLDIVVRPLVALSWGGCSRRLLQVQPTKLHRGVRLKWCYYPLGPKYDLVYRDQEWVQLVHRYVIQYTRASGDKVKSIRRWKASMNLADVLGWGLSAPRRAVVLWDMLRHGSCPDPAVQNWLLTSGGLVVRIDANQQMIPNAHPEGRNYIQFLQLLTCSDRWANQTWKQMDLYEGLVHATLSGPEHRFVHTKLFSKPTAGSGWTEFQYPDPVEANEHPECPDCNVCLQHRYHITKMFRHNANSFPPPACHACWRCQRDFHLGGGVPLTTDVEGCTDVEGVDGHSSARPEFCDETQERAIMRPSTKVLKDKFEAKNMALRPEMLADE